MAQFKPPQRCARPVADAPIDELLRHSPELAKGWLLALVEQAPLARASAVASDDFAETAPQLCEAILRALADDLELRRLEADGTLRGLAARVGELGGAQGEAVAVVRAVDALRRVLWAALRVQLGAADGDLVADLAQRLESVCALLRVAGLQRDAMTPRGRETVVASWGPKAPEGADGSAALKPDEDRAPPRRPGDSLWVGALQDAIDRSDGEALSLLLAECEDVERVTAIESPEGAGFARFAEAVRGVVRRQDILVRETDTRAWIIAPDTARRDAHTLGARVADAVQAGTGRYGAALVATVGLAVLGEDGRTADELIAAAEEARFAASASGTDVSR